MLRPDGAALNRYSENGPIFTKRSVCVAVTQLDAKAEIFSTHSLPDTILFAANCDHRRSGNRVQQIRHLRRSVRLSGSLNNTEASSVQHRLGDQWAGFDRVEEGFKARRRKLTPWAQYDFLENE